MRISSLALLCSVLTGCFGAPFETDLFPDDKKTSLQLGDPRDGGGADGDAEGGGGASSAGSGGSGGAAPVCAHDLCGGGTTLLDPACDPCVATVIAQLPECATTWDIHCAGATVTYCGSSCHTSPGTCDHDVCVEGSALDGQCSTCAFAVCLDMPGCCTSTWSAACADYVTSRCPGTC